MVQLVLIETLWNVKKTRNRSPRPLTEVLIETLWNVKVATAPASSDQILVLIETLWNVKRDTGNLQNESTFVLIETLWNVKRYTYVNKGCAPYGINRNIVECKGRSNKKIKIPRAVLIETLWNVKSVLPHEPVRNAAY
mgnify:CR=1 FL=1